VARCRSRRQSSSESGRFAGALRDGETRTRTGDTTIFRESRETCSAREAPANRQVRSRDATPRYWRLRPVTRRFGTSGRARSPKRPALDDLLGAIHQLFVAGRAGKVPISREFLVAPVGALFPGIAVDGRRLPWSQALFAMSASLRRATPARMPFAFRMARRRHRAGASRATRAPLWAAGRRVITRRSVPSPPVWSARSPRARPRAHAPSGAAVGVISILRLAESLGRGIVTSTTPSRVSAWIAPASTPDGSAIDRENAPRRRSRRK
jgi:hypothetical protein